MSKTPSSAPGTDPRRFATPATPHVQTENTVDLVAVNPATVDAANDAQPEADATEVDRDDERRKREQAPKSPPGRDTSQLPVPGDARLTANTPPVKPKAIRGS